MAGVGAVVGAGVGVAGVGAGVGVGVGGGGCGVGAGVRAGVGAGVGADVRSGQSVSTTQTFIKSGAHTDSPEPIQALSAVMLSQVVPSFSHISEVQHFPKPHP